MARSQAIIHSLLCLGFSLNIMPSYLLKTVRFCKKTEIRSLATEETKKHKESELNFQPSLKDTTVESETCTHNDSIFWEEYGRARLC